MAFILVPNILIGKLFAFWGALINYRAQRLGKNELGLWM
jgi:hypothetical protein